MTDLTKVLAEALSQDDPSPSHSGSSSEGRSLDTMRRGNPRFDEDEQNAVEAEAAEPNDTEDQAAEGSERSPSDETSEQSDKLGDDVVALQKRLVLGDKARAKMAQENAFIKTKIQELDPYIKVGMAVLGNKRAAQAVQKIMAGEDPTKAEGEALANVAEKQGIDPGQLLLNVRQTVQDELSRHTMARRQWEKLEKRASKELPHFTDISDHPEYLAYVSIVHDAIDSQTLEVPEGEDRQFFALQKAHDIMVASKPEYIEAVRKLGEKQGRESTAKKLAAAGPSGSSRGSTDAKGRKLSTEEEDRLAIVKAFHGRSGNRRLPSARR